ncbi:MAG: DUF2157 domain-containing protein [Burkholderiales bacterium]|nr:DUF2157 domain-containing protein [Burkholderiales bacterium]
MRIARADLDDAAAGGLLPPEAVAPLWNHLAARDAGAAPRSAAAATAAPDSPRFSFTHLLYYFGGLLAIGAATLFMTEGFQRLGSWGLFAIAVAYAAACVWAAGRLDARGLAIPAGIVATLAICLVPLATWAIQHAFGLWPEGGTGNYRQYHTHIDWRWLTLEFVTLAAAAVALWALRHPFLMMPVAITLWYMSMDLARLVVAPGSGSETWTFYRDFSMFFGLAMALLGFWIDARSRAPGASRRDYAFWLYLLGMLTFWCALTARRSDSEVDKLLYGLLNLGFVFLGAVLQRRIFTILGGLGVALYLGHLSYKVFKDSLLFPLALTLIGFAVIAGGIWWQRHEARMQALMRARLPAALQRWLPPAAGG